MINLTWRSFFSSKKKKYQVSNKGNLRSVDKNTNEIVPLNGSTIQGYNVFRGRNEDGIQTDIFTHKAVAEKFVKKEGKGMNIVIHKDGNKANNDSNNLKWVDKKEQVQHHVELGTYSQKDKPPTNAKIDRKKAEQIKNNKGKVSRSLFSKLFGISKTQVKRIENGENWK